MSRRIPLLVITTVLATSLLLTGCKHDQEAVVKDTVIRPVKLTTIGNLSVAVRHFPAEFVATEETDLTFRVSGQLESLPVVPGQQVKKGQLLAALDDKDFKLNVSQKQTAYDLAKLQQRRISAMVKQRAATQSQLDEINNTVKQASTALQQAKNQLTYSRIKAPFDGVIAKVYADNYEAVSAAAPILKLEDAETIDVQFQIPEDFVARIQSRGKTYQPTVIIDSMPDEVFKANYKDHSTNPDPNTKGYTVNLTMQRPDSDKLLLLPGMTAEVQVNTNILLGDSQYWLVPVEAVFAPENQPLSSQKRSVWIYNPENNQLNLRDVVIGELQGDQLQIVSGLKEGDQVVSAGVHAMREGMEVRPWVKERGL
jgi:RND family efflux transporter MFP subunit